MLLLIYGTLPGGHLDRHKNKVATTSSRTVLSFKCRIGGVQNLRVMVTGSHYANPPGEARVRKDTLSKESVLAAP